MEKTDLIALTTEIVSSYVSNSRLDAAELPALIASTYNALNNLSSDASPEPEAAKNPAVPIKKSISADYLICLEDGKKFKSLKRHLRTTYDLSPEAYREKWGLPKDYPMVAPNYAAARSALAKKAGLGQSGKGAAKKA